MWKIIYFSYTLSRLHILCWDCPLFFFFFFPLVPTILLSLPPPSPVKPGRHFANVITDPHSHLSPNNLPSLPFPSLFLSLSFPFDITKREEGDDNGGEPRLEGRRCGWLPLTTATSNSRGNWRWWRKHQGRERRWGGARGRPTRARASSPLGRG